MPQVSIPVYIYNLNFTIGDVNNQVGQQLEVRFYKDPDNYNLGLDKMNNN